MSWWDTCIRNVLNKKRAPIRKYQTIKSGKRHFGKNPHVLFYNDRFAIRKKRIMWRCITAIPAKMTNHYSSGSFQKKNLRAGTVKGGPITWAKEFGFSTGVSSPPKQTLGWWFKYPQISGWISGFLQVSGHPLNDSLVVSNIFFVFSPLPGEDSQFDSLFFFKRVGSTTN